MKNRMLIVICGLALAAAAPAADIYVATNATPAGPFTNWSGAFTNLQDALDYARTNTGEAVTNIYLAGHVFQGTGVASSVFTWQNCTNLNLRGGYAATNDDTPGARGTNWSTILRRSGGAARVLLLTNLANCLIEQVTIRDGTGVNGSGAYLTFCTNLVFSDCGIITNGGSSCLLGGGLHLTNSSTVTLTNCMLISNYVYGATFSNPRMGGAAFVSANSRLTVIRSFVSANRAPAQSESSTAYGGGCYVGATAWLDLRESVLCSNTTPRESIYAVGYGGAICNAGTLSMRNCLVVSNCTSTPKLGDALYTTGSSATNEILSCTFADNNAVGICNDGARSIVVSNSIVWGHATLNLQGFPTNNAGVLSNVWCSDIGGGQIEGTQGCHSADPCFADRAYYHLQSTKSNYAGGYFSGGTWTNAFTNSPLIDRGNPAEAYDREPEPNGSRLNLGAYGNTEAASQTPEAPSSPPAVTNPGAQAVGHRTAVLRGAITNDGGEAPEVTFYYWTNSAAATNAAYVGVKCGSFGSAFSGLTPGAAYQYYFVATNRAGAATSGPAGFITHALTSTLFVATNGNHTAGTNWATAYTNVPTAWNISEAGDTIYLAGGTYEGFAYRCGYDGYIGSTGCFVWANAANVAMRGGYRAATEDDPAAPGERDCNQWPTIFRSTINPMRVFLFRKLTNCVLDGVTIRDGTGVNNGGDYGTGLFVSNSAVILTNCLITANMSDANNLDMRGGGIWVDAYSCLTIARCVLSGNRATGKGYGGGLAIASGGRVDLFDTVLATNVASGTGKGYGGAIYNEGTLLMRNCLVVSNASPTSLGAGIYSSGIGMIENCTLTTNLYVAIYCGGGQLAVTNSIVWGNPSTDLMNLPADGQGRLTTVSHSLFGTAYGAAYLYSPMHGVNGCITNNPAFTNAAAGDYHLLADSPAINAGINQPWMAGASDLDGLKPRIRGLVVDLGCYEAAPRPGAVWKTR